jgi:hypothetical protein
MIQPAKGCEGSLRSYPGLANNDSGLDMVGLQ